MTEPLSDQEIFNISERIFDVLEDPELGLSKLEALGLLDYVRGRLLTTEAMFRELYIAERARSAYLRQQPDK